MLINRLHMPNGSIYSGITVRSEPLINANSACGTYSGHGIDACPRLFHLLSTPTRYPFSRTRKTNVLGLDARKGHFDSVKRSRFRRVIMDSRIGGRRVKTDSGGHKKFGAMVKMEKRKNKRWERKNQGWRETEAIASIWKLEQEWGIGAHKSRGWKRPWQG